MVSCSQLYNVPSGDFQYRFDATALPGGVYFCRLGYENEKILTTKVVLLK
ncbi:hypothetical protein JXQ31_08790 [candidate division KSB1 bacterium]|nr:hypothetical protein [candidate division KSB1 bacterium]